MYENVILYDGSPRTRHLMDNLIIDLVDGADEATGRCYYTVLQGGEPGDADRADPRRSLPRPVPPRPDGWQFADREFHIDLVGDLSRHFRG